MKLLINYNFGESYMKTHAKVVSFMFSLHYFFLELIIIKYFHPAFINHFFDEFTYTKP